MKAVEEGFAFVSATEAATEVEYSIVIIQREGAEEFFQFFEPFTDFRWVGFVGFCVGLVKLIQDGFAITVTGVEGMGGYVGIQPLCNILSIPREIEHRDR